MSLPNDTEILATLDRLSGAVADDLESPHLEFKPWTDAKADKRSCFVRNGLVEIGLGVFFDYFPSPTFSNAARVLRSH